MTGDAENRDLGRIDDRRERRAADTAEARDRETCTLQLAGFELAIARQQRQLAEFLRDLVDIFLVRVTNHRDHQSLLGVRGESEMAVLFIDEALAVVRQRRVDLGKFLQRRDTGFHDERERRQRNAPLLRRPLEFLAFRFELGDVREIVLRDVRQIDPAGLQPRPGYFLDARQRLDSISPNFAKSTIGVFGSAAPPAPASARSGSL